MCVLYCLVIVFLSIVCVYIRGRLQWFLVFFFLMIRRPPRSTLDRSSAASDVYKRQDMDTWVGEKLKELEEAGLLENTIVFYYGDHGGVPVSYTHLRAHETVLDLVCRLLLEKKKK